MKVLDEVVVRVIPERYDGSCFKCRITVRRSGEVVSNYEKVEPTDDFESVFHRLMRAAEEEIVGLVKKEDGG